MDLSVTSTTLSGSTTNVFRTTHGFDSALSVTIDASNLVAGDMVDGAFPGVLPAGFPLGVVTADGTYAMYDNANSDGTEVLVGLLREDVDVASATSIVHGAMLIHAIVIEANLPVAIDANGKTDNASVQYV